MRIKTLLERLPLLLALCGIAAALFFLAVCLPRLLAPVALLERAFSLAAGCTVVCTERSEERKVSKLFLLFLPWLGAILCFCFLPRGGSALPAAGEGIFSLSSAFLSLPPASAERIEYFAVGREMFDRLLPDLQNAKRRIYLEYYIIAGGVFWDSVFSVLAERAACGVDVRLIYDGFGCLLTRRRAFVREAERRGIRTVCFRPLRLRRGAGRRDHRKLAVVDGIVYTGGINLADEYIGEKIRFGHWKDTAVRAEGEIADRFASLFLRTFRSLRGSSGGTMSETADMPMPASPIPCTVVADGADGDVRFGASLLPCLTARAERTIRLFTPYLAPDAALSGALLSAAARGVDVRIMIPHIPDKKWMFAVTRSYARDLERGGVRVREYAPGFLHAKNAVFDGSLVLISSYNLDFRSLYLQAECGLLAESEALAEETERDFLSCWDAGVPLARGSAAGRLLARLCRLFAPLL